MSKGIELTPSQIKAHENGATMFMFPIKKEKIPMTRKAKNVGYVTTRKELNIQKGDKDVFIQEEDYIYWTEEECFQFGVKQPRDIIPTSKMTKEQSIHSFKEVLDVRVVRVQDIEDYEIVKIVKGFDICDIYNEIEDDIRLFYNQQLKELNINRTYEDNDYVFLIEIKR